MDGSSVIDLSVAVKVLTLALDNLVFEKEAVLDARPFLAVLEHLSKTAPVPENRGRIYLLAATDRNLSRLRKNGRFSDAPDTKQQAEEAREKAGSLPTLMLFRQNGAEHDGWKGLPFWWPVLLAPSDATTCVFAAQSADDEMVNSVPDDEEAVAAPEPPEEIPSKEDIVGRKSSASAEERVSPPAVATILQPSPKTRLEFEFLDEDELL